MSRRPILLVDAQGRGLQSTADNLTERIDYVGGTVPVYIGRGRPGAEEDAEEWQICFLEYDGANNVVSRKWAKGSNDFLFEWDERANYNYS